jgi:Fe-S cluster assembly protein SufD
MSVEATLGHYVNTHETAKGQLPGAKLGWLNDARQQALGQFCELGFPTTRDEDWKYTRVTALQKRQFELPQAVAGDLDADTLSGLLVAGLDCHQLVFVNGRYAPTLSSADVGDKSITVLPLSMALDKSPEALETQLGMCAGAPKSGFSALNTAFLGEGAYVHLSADATLDRPLMLLFVSTEEQSDLMTHPRILVVAEARSKAVVIEKYASVGENNYFNNAMTEVILGEEAEVDHYKLQEESHKAFHIATLEVRQARGSRFVSHSVSLGGQLVRSDINSDLGEHAFCELNGLYMATGRQHMDFHTRIDHTQPHGTSKEFYKGILDGRSRGVFNGRVYVHRDAQKTDAEQSNKNLLLSRNAEIDTKPQLEIYADDVKCAHGATVGQLDENMIFYLRSRGIDATAARSLLTYGFASEVLDAMALVPVKEGLRSQLLEWLPNAEQVRELVQ